MRFTWRISYKGRDAPSDRIKRLANLLGMVATTTSTSCKDGKSSAGTRSAAPKHKDMSGRVSDVVRLVVATEDARRLTGTAGCTAR